MPSSRSSSVSTSRSSRRTRRIWPAATNPRPVALLELLGRHHPDKAVGKHARKLAHGWRSAHGRQEKPRRRGRGAESVRAARAWRHLPSVADEPPGARSPGDSGGS